MCDVGELMPKVKVIIASSFRRCAYYCRENDLRLTETMFISSREGSSYLKLHGMLPLREEVVILDPMYRTLRLTLESRVRKAEVMRVNL